MSVPLAGPPPTDTPAPVGLHEALDSFGLSAAHVSPVWLNGAGGLTFSVASAGPAGAIDFFVKCNPATTGESLADEAARLQWIQGRHQAPVVVGLIEVDGNEILLTKALSGLSAVSDRWKAQPNTALRALGIGLRQLHSVAIDDCAFDWGVAHRLRSAGVDADCYEEAPALDQFVLCQGDPCAPNTLLTADGTFLAHVDLARLGVADRWADLAVMTMSMEWNYRNYDESIFWSAYGIEPDRRRIDYYRRLWNAT